METLAFVLVGLLVGVGINLLADKLPPESKFPGLGVCPACGGSLPPGRRIGLWRELSRSAYCPTCRTRLPRRHAVAEVALAGLFAFLWWRYGLSADLAVNSLYLAIVALIFVVDLEHRLVLNVVLLPSAVLALLVALAHNGLVPALIGGAVGFAFLLVIHIIYPQGMGLGDVKLAGFLGLMLGWPMVMQGLFLGFGLAALVSLALIAFMLATKRAKLRDALKSYIPYAPSLVTGAYLALLFPPGG